jgi:hypothetical protein
MNASGICQLEADQRFGPRVVGCRDNFDFTLLFEQIVLSLAPSALLVILSICRVLQLRRHNVKTLPTFLHYGKSVRIPHDRIVMVPILLTVRLLRSHFSAPPA